MNRRKYLVTTGGAITIGTVSGCLGGGGTDEVETDDSSFDLTVSLVADSGNGIDPHQTNSLPTSPFLDAVYDGLLGRDNEGNIVPRLATDWYREEPGRFRFELREDVSFHEGQEFTADDVVFSVNRMIDDDFGPASVRKNQLGGWEGAEAINKYTVDIISDGLNTNIEIPSASYLGLMIMNQEWTENQDDDEIILKANGTGPFEMIEFTNEESATLEPFDDFWGDQSEIATLEMEWVGEDSTRVNSLLAGETHLSEALPVTDVGRVADSDDTYVAPNVTPRIVGGYMNHSVEPFDSIEFREALNLAVDVEQYLDNQLFGEGTPVSQAATPTQFGYDPNIEPPEYDPERATELVEASGYAGAEITLSLGTGRLMQGEEIATSIVDMIDSLPNVSCDLELMDFSTYINRATDQRDLDFYINGYGQPSYDSRPNIGFMMLNPDSTPLWPITAEQEKVEEVERLWEESFSEENEEEGERKVQQAHQIFVEDQAILFLHQQPFITGVSTEISFDSRPDELISTRNIEIR